jgi:Ca2+-binding RTX toxin-like protein
MANITTSESLAVGTTEDDIILGDGSGTVPQTIYGGEGDDVILGDHAPVLVDASAANNTLATALDLETGYWSSFENPDTYQPVEVYTSVLATGADAVDWFVFTVGADEFFSVDVDYGFGGDAADYDFGLRLYDAAGNLLYTEYDSLPGLDGQGSSSGQDPHFSWANTSGTAQTFYVKVFIGPDAGVPLGAAYMLNLQVTDHAVDGTIVGAADVLFGNTGSDTLKGVAGDDTLMGQEGADVLIGGSGLDTASYLFSLFAVNVDLGTGYTAGGEAEGDVLQGVEALVGSYNDDWLTGDSGANTLDGSAGFDALTGGGGDDVLIDSGANSVLGGDGSDYLYVGDLAGGTWDGGDGLDTLDLSADTLAGVYFYLGTTQIVEGATLSGFENLIGTQGGDVVFGTAAGNLIYGWSGDDTLVGAGGDDILDGGLGVDTVQYLLAGAGVSVDLLAFQATGGHGTDTLYGFERIDGSGYDDVLSGDDADNTLNGSGGADYLTGRSGSDWFIAGLGADTLDGGSQFPGDPDIDTADFSGSGQAMAVILDPLGAGEWGTADDGAGVDQLRGIEQVIGSAYDDFLAGGEVAELLIGGAGDDTVNGGGGADYLEGGDGIDTLSYSYFIFGVGVTVELAFGFGQGGMAEGDLFNGFENLTGSYGADVLGGDSGANRIDGSEGNDTVRGGGGLDTLLGGFGDDRLEDGGNNRVFGEAGDDLVVITATNQGYANARYDGGAGYDTVQFDNSTANTIVLAPFFGPSDNVPLHNFEAATGGFGNDVIVGTAGANFLSGRSGDDFLYGRDGDDILAGGDGFDTVVFSGPSARQVDLAVGTVQDTGEGLDLLISIEGVRSGNAADTLYGNDLDNRLEAGKGANFVQGRGGNDTIIVDGNSSTGWSNTLSGGGGDDRILAALEFLAIGFGTSAYYGDDGNDYLQPDQFDIAYGGAGNDELVGSAVGVTLDGGAGDDRLETFYGYVGYDLAGNPVRPTDGVGRLVGGAGVDTAVFNAALPPGPVSVTVDLVAGTATASGAPSSWTLAGIENLVGDDWADTLRGNNAENVLDGGAGADVLDGRGGFDTVTYARSNAAVSVNLANGAGAGGHASGDQLTSIERLIGSDHADTLIGRADGYSTLDGGLGADTLQRAAGIGTGYLYVSYARSNAEVRVDLRTGAGQGGHAQGDTLINVDHVFGSAFDDVLIGDATRQNLLFGGAGADRLSGLGGDHLYGEAGDDIFEVFASGPGPSINGGDGSDALWVSHAQNTFIDLRQLLLSAQSVERLVVQNTAGDNGEVRLTAVQLAAFTQVSAVNGPGAVATLAVDHNGGALDLSFVPVVGFDAADRFRVFGGATGETISGWGFRDSLEGGGGADVLRGAGGADSLFGGEGEDTLEGGDGVDRLDGGAGRDTLKGGEGADTLVGGAGRDRMTGGTGPDVFRFAAGDSTTGKAGRDVLTDFVVGVDKLDLTALALPDFAARVRLSVSGGDTLVRVDVDGDGAFDDFGLKLAGTVGLTAADFLL